MRSTSTYSPFYTFFSASKVPAQRMAGLSLAIALLCPLLLTACSKAADNKQPGPAAVRPPAEVGVVTVTPGDVGLVTELPGRLEASRIAQVRARAAGILQKRLFREGSDVKAGQPLFTIDSAPYAAVAASARAQCASSGAQLSADAAHCCRNGSEWLVTRHLAVQQGWPGPRPGLWQLHTVNTFEHTVNTFPHGARNTTSGLPLD